jgi:hypothetical protein
MNTKHAFVVEGNLILSLFNLVLQTGTTNLLDYVSCTGAELGQEEEKKVKESIEV